MFQVRWHVLNQERPTFEFVERFLTMTMSLPLQSKDMHYYGENRLIFNIYFVSIDSIYDWWTVIELAAEK